MKGFRTTFKLYDYPNSDEIHYFLYGADFRYEGNNWKVETEAMKRDDKVANKDLFSAYVQGAYWHLSREVCLKILFPQPVGMRLIKTKTIPVSMSTG